MRAKNTTLQMQVVDLGLKTGAIFKGKISLDSISV